MNGLMMGVTSVGVWEKPLESDVQDVYIFYS